MARIKVKKGLDIPIEGAPTGAVQDLPKVNEIALNVADLDDHRFKLLAKKGDHVLLGQPIVMDKNYKGRNFVAPGSGHVKEIRRGLKRRLLSVVITLDAEEKAFDHGKVDIQSASREDILAKMMESGAMPHLRHRPFNILANPGNLPRSIFVKGIESAPFTPPPSMQIEGFEADFQYGLDTLAKLTDGAVHLVIRQGESCEALTKAKNVTLHTAEGPHPVANSSVHIHHIDPIKTVEDVVWTANVQDVITIGRQMRTGERHTSRVISIAGNGVLPEKRGFFKVREGYPIGALVAGRNEGGLQRLISGDVLTGSKVEAEDFLGFRDTVFCILPENTTREMLHFFRPGLNKYSATRAYFSGHIKPGAKQFSFDTNQHGEHRGFVDAAVYDRVMPMKIPTMLLVKAIQGDDFETAEELGLLEVDSEDFALATFICPSKQEHCSIVKEALQSYAQDVLH